MTDFTGWHERWAKVVTLSLDARNPRIPDAGREATQREVVAELVEHDDVYGLAKGMVEQGYFPTEVLIGIQENERSTIIEGNRRLAALKLLLSPEMAPDGRVARFRLLQNRVNPDTIEKVRVIFAPSREAAAPLIINRHTRTGVERWKPAQQAKYLRSLVSPNVSMAELADHLGVERGDLSNNLRTDTMYRIACGLPLPDGIRTVVCDPRSFNASALERLVQSARAMEFLGIAFDDKGNVIGRVHVDEFKKAYGRMVRDIVRAKIDTRFLNTSQQISDYVSRFGVDAPNRKRKGNFTSESLLASEGQLVTQPPGAVGAPPPVKRRESCHLIPANIKCGLANGRINDVFRELRRLKVRDFPNAVAVLLRIMLELVAGNYLDKTGKIGPILQAAKQRGKPNDWYPSLRQMMTALLADNDMNLVPLARKGLNKMVSDEGHPLSLDKMDQFVHNRYVAPTERELRRLWEALEDLLVQLLVEPAPPARKGP